MEVKRMIGDGNCFFRCVSYFLHGTQLFYDDIRKTVVEEVVNNWPQYSNFVIGDPTYGQIITKPSEYSQVVSKDKVYVGNVEITATTKVFPHLQFRIYTESLRDETIIGEGNDICYLRFSGNVDAGHYDIFFPRSNEMKNQSDSSYSENSYKRNSPIASKQICLDETETPKFKRKRNKVENGKTNTLEIMKTPEQNYHIAGLTEKSAYCKTLVEYTDNNKNKFENSASFAMEHNQSKFPQSLKINIQKNIHKRKTLTGRKEMEKDKKRKFKQSNHNTKLIIMKPVIQEGMENFVPSGHPVYNNIISESKEINMIQNQGPLENSKVTGNQPENNGVKFNTAKNSQNSQKIFLKNIHKRKTLTGRKEIQKDKNRKLKQNNNNTEPAIVKTFTQEELEDSEPISHPVKLISETKSSNVQVQKHQKYLGQMVEENNKITRISENMSFGNSCNILANEFEFEEHTYIVPQVSKTINDNTRRSKPYKRCALNSDFSVLYYDLGPMSLKCDFCEAVHFDCEKIGSKTKFHFNSCCHNKKVFLSPTLSHPLLETILKKDADHEKLEFLINIRKYNSAMSLASFVADETLPNDGRGPYTFRINGQIHYKIGPLHPNTASERSYAQLYIIDTKEATNIRIERNKACNHNLMMQLHKMMVDVNPLVQKYKMMADVEKEENDLALKEGRDPFEVRMFLLNEQPDVSNQTKNRFNLPSADEIAAVFTTRDGDPPGHYDLKVFPKRSGNEYLQTINSLHQLADPMLYPLLFPHGERGWDKNQPHEKETNGKCRKVTRLQYVSYRMAIRRRFSLLHSSGKLWLQYLVDQYVRVEGERLFYIRTQLEQKKLRVETFAGLQDYLQNEAHDRGVKPGKMVILPSTFQGSPRNMNMHYQDAMALVRAFGKPSLFITFTCNPKWKEITENLGYATQPNYRPELIARVFKAKLDELISDLTKIKIFGEVVCHLYVIEFQKRGLPHCHLLLTLTEEDTIREVEHIDKVVSAELPSPENPALFEVVKSCMIHGPCGNLNPRSPCMKDGNCTKNFPKPYAPVTKENYNGYPVYKRRNDGRHFVSKVNGRLVAITNEWVVPYNPYLSTKYQAHINVEVCSTVKAVKYLHKYVYKGYDSTNIKFVNLDENGRLDYDEVSRYVNMRYVSAPEACWRLLEFPMQAKSHTVQKLAIHLPSHQNVYIQEETNIRELVQKEHAKTTLTAFFELNQNDEEARSILYQDIPKKYIYEKNYWKRRKTNRPAIGRIYTVSPKHEETFALRLLLVSVPGPTSFDYLKTFNGVVFKTFKEAAIARNLLDSDDQYDIALDEAASNQMPKQFRAMFAYLCAFCSLNDAMKLFLKFEESLTEDFRGTLSLENSRNQALLDIGKILMSHSLSLKSVGLPEVDLEAVPDTAYLESIEQMIAEEMIPNLSSEQKHIFNCIVASVTNQSTDKKAFFISGAGGSGKTFLYEVLLHYFRGKGIKCSAVAWTGIAAMLLPGGRTSHSLFRFPIPLFENSVSSIKPDSKEGKELNSTKVFIFDEASMIPANALTCLDRLLRDISNIDKPFGGKTIILGGDFQQVLPVVPHSARGTIVENCLKSCQLWPCFEKLHLKRNMRANKDELEFVHFLSQVGSGRGNFPNSPYIQIPKEMLCQNNIIESIFGNDLQNLSENLLKGKAILCPKNAHCTEINDQIVKSLPGEDTSYFSLDSVVTEYNSERCQYPVEFLHTLEMSGLPPHVLHLKKGAVVMLIRNLNSSQGLVNGTRMIVRDLYINSIAAEILCGEYKGTLHILPRIPLTPSDSTFPFTLKRTQLPVILSFALTINKCQGQTLENVGIYLPEPVFSHGMLYVALSRTRSKSAIKVLITHNDAPGFPTAEGWTKNIVFNEILD